MATTVIFITFGVFIVQAISEALTGNDLSHWFGLSRSNAPWVYPFVSYMFLHDVRDISHIVINMLSVYFFGRDIESEIGPRRFVGLYFGAGLVGGLAHIAATQAFVIGASGGCLGLIAYYGFAYPNRQVILFVFPIRAITLVFILVGFDAWRVLRAAGGAVAYFAHLGGALYGFLFWKLKLDPLPSVDAITGRYRRWRQRHTAVQQTRQREEVDRILQKITEHGLNSLSESERRFLDQASRDIRNRR